MSQDQKLSYAYEFKVYDKRNRQMRGGVFQIYDEPETRNEGATLT